MSADPAMSTAGGRARGLVAATHPAPAAVVTLFALALALRVSPTTGTAVLVTTAVGAGQLSVGWSNDWLDAARDRRVGRADKPTVTGAVAPGTLRAAALGALGACAVLSLATGLLPGLLHLAAVAGAWAYNAGLKATAWSWLPYAVSFGLLPAFVLTAAGATVPPWVVAAAALLGVGAHVANVLPDLEDDRATGVRGLPHRLGRRASIVLAPVMLAAGCMVALLGPTGPPGAGAGALAAAAGALAVGAGAAGVLRPASRAPFALSMAVAAACVVQVVAAVPPSG
ncbi:UbiA family prenyltransferase [Isoptericola sp. BMS4]|uniref:UbiA family prenyltransferase n=1 Tax=Isoptericola sp. BMS4 TaxID=2527875 RepID=UPI001F103C67|nr:UbiA family prenyltransferase [Isoptericola sp. BMS4]